MERKKGMRKGGKGRLCKRIADEKLRRREGGKERGGKKENKREGKEEYVGRQSLSLSLSLSSGGRS